MKQLVLSIFLFVGLSSCSSSYYYSTVSSSSDQNYQLDNGSFVNENDSVLVTYSFNGSEGPVNISIFNKTEIPLLVNWQESSLIIDSEAIPYFDGKASFEGDNYGESVNQFSGSLNTPQNSSYIPPHAKVSYNSLKLNPYHIFKIDKKYYTQERIKITEHFSTPVKVIDFDNNNTPLAFRSYLSMCFAQSQPFSLDDTFYISHIMKTSKSPESLPENLVNRANVFNIVDVNNTGGYIAFGAIAAGFIIYNVVTDPPVEEEY